MTDELSDSEKDDPEDAKLRFARFARFAKIARFMKIARFAPPYMACANALDFN